MPQKVIAEEAGSSQTDVSKVINRKLSKRKMCGKIRCKGFGEINEVWR